MTKGPPELVGQLAAILDEVGISYALGGSKFVLPPRASS
jgi:hypothetical protein